MNTKKPNGQQVAEDADGIFGDKPLADDDPLVQLLEEEARYCSHNDCENCPRRDECDPNPATAAQKERCTCTDDCGHEGACPGVCKKKR